MTPLPRVSDVCGKDGLKRYARAGANEGANACAIAAFARLSKFALVLCPMIHEVTDILGLHAVKQTPIDAGHPLKRGDGGVVEPSSEIAFWPDGSDFERKTAKRDKEYLRYAAKR